MKNLIYILFLIPITLLAQDWHEEQRTYKYDNLNRLVKVVFNNGIVYKYQYDKLGNRLGKTIDIELPQNNYDVSTVGLTCINSSDGIIKIEVDRKNTYNIEIDSPDNSFNETHTLKNSNEWKLNIDYLDGGEYFVYVTIDGISEDIYKKTFILNLDEPEPLEAVSSKSSNGKYAVTMTKGTAPYTIKVNNEIIKITSESEYSFDVLHGDVVEVYSSKACEGKFIETINVLDDFILYPSPTDDIIYFATPISEKINNLNIQLFDMNGRLVETYNKRVLNSKIELSIKHLSNGVYLAKFPSLGDKTFKIVKK